MHLCICSIIITNNITISNSNAHPDTGGVEKEARGLGYAAVAACGTCRDQPVELRTIVHVLNTAEKSRMTAAHVMHTPVFSIQASEPITLAVDIMNLHNISQIPVIEDGVPVGCISESAIVSVIDEQSAHRAHGLAVKSLHGARVPQPPGMDINRGSGSTTTMQGTCHGCRGRDRGDHKA